MSTDNTPYLVIWLRSLAFWIVFPVSMVIFANLLLFTVFLSLQTRWRLLQVWVNFILWWLKVTCKLTHEVQGSEHITQEAGIVF
jgi:1-acyl-sn-glycerol-3-phosphate acyltransferase